MNKKKRKLSSAENARRRARIKSKSQHTKSKPAKPSNYLHWLKKYHKKHPDMRAIIVCRVSSGPQSKKGNLKTQERALRKKLKKLNISILGCYLEVSSGWVLNGDRRALLNATKAATKHKAVIVATSTDRFLRNRDFHTAKRPDLLPTKAEFEKLKKLTRGVPLLTLLHPDMPPGEVRSRQTRLGQKAKGNKGGRPTLKRPGFKREIRKRKLPQVRRLLMQGKNPTEISRILGVPRSTVCDWIER